MAQTTESVDDIPKCDHCEKIFSNFLACNEVCNCVRKSVCTTSSSKTKEAGRGEKAEVPTEGTGIFRWDGRRLQVLSQTPI